ncbi:putative Arylacetamide deacetylase [Hypsibius exemplaris]|uniref:Arylacetamide deacetylase n=1 Tax=Hypsibius exemplaris TaxID=2072580 RepID=A0A1W0WP21_HYPEX|nr:putative Arylacetamide deacetylase [Hypsibius exemplaris]
MFASNRPPAPHGASLLSLRALCLAAASGIGLAVLYLRWPYEYHFPKGDAWRIRFLTAESKLLSFIARWGSRLRIGSEIAILRRLYYLESCVLCVRTPKADIFTEVLDADGVRIIVYRRLAWVTAEDEPDGPRKPCIIYLHGGGWVYTCAEERDAHHRHLLTHLEAVVAAVDYRKAPEHPYPAGFHDCLTATKFIHSHAASLGVEPSRISICGDSAGGNLSAAVALKLRDEGQKFLKNQVLIYPSVQFLSSRLTSHLQVYPLLTREDGVWCGLQYMGEDVALCEALLDGDHIAEELYRHPGFLALQKYDSIAHSESKSLASPTALAKLRDRIKDPYLCPLMARTMKALPRALILLCDYDILRDDGLAYADRLRADGVTVTTVSVPGYHGCFRNFQVTRCGAMMMDHLVKYLKEHL